MHLTLKRASLKLFGIWSQEIQYCGSHKSKLTQILQLLNFTRGWVVASGGDKKSPSNWRRWSRPSFASTFLWSHTNVRTKLENHKKVLRYCNAIGTFWRWKMVNFSSSMFMFCVLYTSTHIWQDKNDMTFFIDPEKLLGTCRRCTKNVLIWTICIGHSSCILCSTGPQKEYAWGPYKAQDVHYAARI